MYALPENGQLDVYTVQKDTPFLEYQHPFPLMEGPNGIHSSQEYIHEMGPGCSTVKRCRKRICFQLPCQALGSDTSHS